jgi:hypothetical protein
MATVTVQTSGGVPIDDIRVNRSGTKLLIGYTQSDGTVSVDGTPTTVDINPPGTGHDSAYEPKLGVEIDGDCVIVLAAVPGGRRTDKKKPGRGKSS